MHNIGITFSSGKVILTYGKGKNPVNYIMPKIVNKFPNFFERTFLKFIFHPDGIKAYLTK